MRCLLGELTILSCSSVSNIVVSAICVAGLSVNGGSAQLKWFSFENWKEARNPSNFAEKSKLKVLFLLEG